MPENIPFIELPGVPVRSPEQIQERYEALRALLPAHWGDDIRNQVALFARAVLTTDVRVHNPKTGFLCSVHAFVHSANRPSVERVFSHALASVVNRPHRQLTIAWEEFATRESDFAQTQIILLWLDMLACARRHTPSDVPVFLTDLLPTGRVPDFGSFAPDGFGAYTEAMTLRIDALWQEEFIRLLTGACALRTRTIRGLFTALSSELAVRLAREDRLELPLQGGRTMTIARRDLDFCLAPIPEDERASWGFATQDGAESNMPKRMPLHSSICQRLHAIAETYEDAPEKQPSSGPLVATRHDLEIEARGLIDQLETGHVPPVAIDEVSIALSAMAGVLSEYEDSWHDYCLEIIFPTN